MVNTSDPSDATQPGGGAIAKRSSGSSIRWALGASIGFHVLLVIALLITYFPASHVDPTAASADSHTPAPAESSVNDSEPLVAQSPPPSTDVPPDQIEASIQAAIESSAKANEERKLDELQRNVQRLEQVASATAIGEIGQAVRTATGLEERATEPMPAAATGGFDFDSAQFHDVTRQADSGGKWSYRSVLLDAQGRTFEVDLTEAEGKTAYDTMQIVKSSPFAEAIYRSMVMPMMDKMIPKVSPTTTPPNGSQPASSAAEETP